MSAIKATVRGGRLELDVPADWPEGTEVEIYPVSPSPTRERRPSQANAAARASTASEQAESVEPAAEADSDEAWLNSPEAIADWLRWFDTLEPLELTPAEEADTQAWMKKLDEYSISKIEKRVEDIFP